MTISKMEIMSSMEMVPCVHFLEAKYNPGTNEVTERLQSVSLLLGEDKKASLQKSKTEPASRISPTVVTEHIPQAPHLTSLSHTYHLSPWSLVVSEERVP